MYWIDTPTGRIDAFDYDLDTGRVSGRRPHVVIDEEWGSPDGMCIDDEDRLWVAFWGGSAVRCLDGTDCVEVVELPTPLVTCLTFAGPDLDQIVITTASIDVPADLPGAGDALPRPVAPARPTDSDPGWDDQPLRLARSGTRRAWRHAVAQAGYHYLNSIGSESRLPRGIAAGVAVPVVPWKPVAPVPSDRPSPRRHCRPVGPDADRTGQHRRPPRPNRCRGRYERLGCASHAGRAGPGGSMPTFAWVEGVQDYDDVDTGLERRAYRRVDHVFTLGGHPGSFSATAPLRSAASASADCGRPAPEPLQTPCW